MLYFGLSQAGCCVIYISFPQYRGGVVTRDSKMRRKRAFPTCLRNLKRHNGRPYGGRCTTKRSSSIRLTKLEDDGRQIQFDLLPPLDKGVFEETIPFVFEVAGQDSVTVPVTIYAYVTSDLEESTEPMGDARNAP